MVLRLFRGTTNCDLVVPYKTLPPPSYPTFLPKLAANFLAIEKWATYFSRNCLPAGSGSCLTATYKDRVFDPTALGGSGATTSAWRPTTTMNLTRLVARGSNAPDGSDLTFELWDSVSSSQKGGTVTLIDSTDTEVQWTGSVPVDDTMLLYFVVVGSGFISNVCVQAWFDGPGGGGLIFYPEPGA